MKFSLTRLEDWCLDHMLSIVVALAIGVLAALALSNCGNKCPGNHVCTGPCVDSVHHAGWFDDGRCYDTRATMIHTPGSDTYECRCPKGAR